MDLTTMTPPEVDQLLADLYLEEGKQEGRLASVHSSAHYAIGERPEYQTKKGRKGWPTSDENALAECQRLVDAGYKPQPGSSGDPAKILAEHKAIVAELARIADAQQVIHNEWRRRGCWSRFYLVTSSDGHIHSDTSCSTCRPTTSYGFLPTLSGLTEADAVADQGPLLCSVCYPSAPVEWTIGRQPAADDCAGGRPDPATIRRRRYGNCPTCGKPQQINGDGRVRKHKSPKQPEKAAAAEPGGTIESPWTAHLAGTS